ncbi:unnamed protein product [Rotaria magnacalcarata]
MGKHRHKKSFYDVDEDDLSSSHKHHRHRHRRTHSPDKQDETKQRVPSIVSFHNSKIEDDEVALLSPPTKRHRSSSSSNTSRSPSKVLLQLIEDPEFLANAGPKAKEFAETARQLLAKPDLDPTTQQIICAMAQAAVNAGKRFSSSSSTPADQCVDEISVTNSGSYSSSTLLSPTLSSASNSSTSNTPQQQFHPVTSSEENKTSTEPESDEDILIKQMIERAMKFTQQGDTRHAQHLLGIIHEKLSNKRKRAAAAAAAASLSNGNDNEKLKISPANEFHLLSNEDSHIGHHHKVPPAGLEQSNDYPNTTCFSYPPPPPLPPPPPPPPSSLPDTNSITSPSVSVPPMEQVQELLSNPSEVQDILKRLFGANDNQRTTPPEEYQMQSHLSATSSYHYQSLPMPYNNSLMYSSLSSRLNNNSQSLRGPPTAETQPYNSSLAFMQGNRRNLPPLQTTDRCFSSSNNKIKQPNRPFSFPASSNNAGVMPALPNTPPPISYALPLMKVNPTFSFGPSTPTPPESIPPRWSNNQNEQQQQQQRGFHPFWCATCALGFPHQIAYQDHLRSHVPCTIPGCSYAATEQLVRIHHMNIHENNVRNRMNNNNNNVFHQIRPMLQPLNPPWPLMRM